MATNKTDSVFSKKKMTLKRKQEQMKQINLLFYDDGCEIVNSIKKTVYQMLSQEKMTEKKPKQERICLYPEWKINSKNKFPTDDTTIKNSSKCSKEEVEFFVIPHLKYLTQLFNKIIGQYKMHWEIENNLPSYALERKGQGDGTMSQDNDVFVFNSNIEEDNEIIEELQKVFVRLIEAIKSVVITEDLVSCKEIMDQLELILLSHKIRGKTLIEIYTDFDTQNCKESSTYEDPYRTKKKESYYKFMEDFLNSSNSTNSSGIENNWQDLRNKESPDSLYLKELLSFPPRKKLDNKEIQTQTMTHAYHLIDSIMAICDSDEDEILNQTIPDEDPPRCGLRVPPGFAPDSNKVVYKIKSRNVESNKQRNNNLIQQQIPKKRFNIESNVAPSQWRSYVHNLQIHSDSKLILNGSISVANKESRKTFVFDAGGNFGSVEIALNNKGKGLALKRISKERSVSNLIKKLVSPLQNLRHNNILHYYLCDFEENELIVATPLCEYNLGQYLILMNKNYDLFLPSKLIIKQILLGLKFLHNRSDPIVHGNLKPSNVFIDVNGTVRVAEFGLNQGLFKLIEPPNSSIIWFSQETLKAYRKSRNFECTCASDVQVAGMLMHFIATAGKHPCGNEMKDILENFEKPIINLALGSVELTDLISWMLLNEPSDRPNIDQILSHITFWSYEKKWNFLVTCAGFDEKGKPLSIQLNKLLNHIDFVSKRDRIRANWVSLVKKKLPRLNLISGDDNTISGLLKLIGTCIKNQNLFRVDLNQESKDFFLTTFPALPLSLYRILQSSIWIKNEAFKQFIIPD